MSEYVGDLQPVYLKPRRGLSRAEAALYIGVSSTKFDELVKDGTMPKPKHIGTRLVWDIRALDDAFDAIDRNEVEVDTWSDV